METAGIDRRGVPGVIRARGRARTPPVALAWPVMGDAAVYSFGTNMVMVSFDGRFPPLSVEVNEPVAPA